MSETFDGVFYFIFFVYFEFSRSLLFLLKFLIVFLIVIFFVFDFHILFTFFILLFYICCLLKLNELFGRLQRKKHQFEKLLSFLSLGLFDYVRERIRGKAPYVGIVV